MVLWNGSVWKAGKQECYTLQALTQFRCPVHKILFQLVVKITEKCHKVKRRLQGNKDINNMTCCMKPVGLLIRTGCAFRGNLGKLPLVFPTGLQEHNGYWGWLRQRFISAQCPSWEYSMCTFQIGCLRCHFSLHHHPIQGASRASFFHQSHTGTRLPCLSNWIHIVAKPVSAPLLLQLSKEAIQHNWLVAARWKYWGQGCLLIQPSGHWWAGILMMGLALQVEVGIESP